MADTDTYEWRLVGTTLTASSTDRILPVINSHFYFVLNESGSGEISIPLDCIAAGIVTEGMLAVLYYRGAIRASFLIENIRKIPASSQEEAGQVLSLSGRGGMTILDRAIVWSDGTTATTRTYTGQTKAQILISLITEAQARGGLSSLTYDFSATDDSASIAWTDSEDYDLTVGTSLLDVVRQFTKIGIEFEMNYSGSDFVLSAYKNGIGTDKSSTVYFRVGTNCQEIDIDQRGNDIRNAMLVAYQDGNVAVTDTSSITANGRREDLIDARLAQSSSSAVTYGSAILSTKKNAQIGRTIKIYDGTSPYLFINYILGDTVTLDIEGVETSDRVLGIQCDFNGYEYSNIVIELNSLMLTQNLQMRQQLDQLTRDWRTAHDSKLIEVSYWANFNGTGDNGYALAMHLVGNKLYVGGSFTKIGGINATYMAEYDISTGSWTAINASGLASNGVLCITSIGSDIYFGGVPKVYKYSGGVVTEIGAFQAGGLVGYINGMTTDGIDLYVTGDFDTETKSTPDVLMANVGKYTIATSTWSAMAGGLPNIGHAIIYFGGNIIAAGGTTAGTPSGYVYSWGGASWTSLKNDFDGEVLALAEYSPTQLLMGGLFTDRLYEWDGATFTAFGAMGGGSSTDYVSAIAIYLTDVYVIGEFTDLGNHIAKYSGGTWWNLTTGISGPSTFFYSALALYETDLYVGGIMTQAGDKAVQGMAIYFTNFESLLDNLENSNSNFDMGAAIHNATAAAVTDADEFPFWEDVANALRKITWTNIKTTIKTYFDTLYVSLTQTPDRIIISNSSGAVTTNANLAYNADGSITIGQIPTGVATTANGIFQSADNVSVANFLQTFGTGVASYITGLRGRGTAASPTAVQAEDVLFRLRGRGYDSAGNVGATSTEIRLVANETHTTTAHGTRLELYTTPNGSTTLTKVSTFGADGTLTAILTNATGLPLTTGVTGILPAANGGTGVNNSTRTLTISANAGTISFTAAASTLTVPSTGTAALLGAQNKFTQNQFIYTASTPRLTMAINGDTTSFGQLVDLTASIFQINKTVATGQVFVDINPIPSDGTSTSQFRFFRAVNTSGAVSFDVYKGNNTSTINCSFAGNGSSCVSLDSGNFGIGTNTYGTSAVKVLAIKNGTEPTTSPADTLQIFAVDLSAGNSTMGIRTETAVATETVTSDRTLSVKINGTVYKICLKA